MTHVWIATFVVSALVALVSHVRATVLRNKALWLLWRNRPDLVEERVRKATVSRMRQWLHPTMDVEADKLAYGTLRREWTPEGFADELAPLQREYNIVRMTRVIGAAIAIFGLLAVPVK